jgi:MerR family transcriptional regulator, light-induced transcriptional regulator
VLGELRQRRVDDQDSALGCGQPALGHRGHGATVVEAGASGFQRERFYRQSEARWRELSRAAALTAVFADFERLHRPRGGPVEVPLDDSVALSREWMIVCDAPNYAACLLAFEPPGQEEVPDLKRRFEAIWTVEPAAVREASRICADYAEGKSPGLTAELRERLDTVPRESTGDDVRAAISLSNRMLGYASSG